MTFAQWLKEQGACREGYDAHHHQTEQEFWDSCQRADWMLWVAERKDGEAGWPDHIGCVRIAAAFARDALQYAGPLTDVSRAAIEAAEAFAANPCEETRAAAEAAGAAAWATEAARAEGDAAWVALAAGGAARAAAGGAARAAAGDAARAARAAAWAARVARDARTAGAAGDAWAARDAANREQADKIRRIWPTVGRGAEAGA